MTFAFPANGKKSRFARTVRRFAFVQGNEQVCACLECVILSLLFWGIYLRIWLKRNKMKDKLAFAICRITSSIHYLFFSIHFIFFFTFSLVTVRACQESTLQCVQQCTVNPRFHRKDCALTTVTSLNPVQSSLTATPRRRRLNHHNMWMEQMTQKMSKNLKLRHKVDTLNMTDFK